MGGFDERFEVGFLENQNSEKRGKCAEPSNRQTSSGGGFPAEPHLVLELVSFPPQFAVNRSIPTINYTVSIPI